MSQQLKEGNVPAEIQQIRERQKVIDKYKAKNKEFIDENSEDLNKESIEHLYSELMDRTQRVTDAFTGLTSLGFVDELGRIWDVSWDKNENGKVVRLDMNERGYRPGKETHFAGVIESNDIYTTRIDYFYADIAPRQSNNIASVVLTFQRFERFFEPLEKALATRV